MAKINQSAGQLVGKPLDDYRKAREAAGYGGVKKKSAQQIVDDLLGKKSNKGNLAKQVRYLRLFQLQTQEDAIAAELKKRGHLELAKELKTSEARIKREHRADRKMEYRQGQFPRGRDGKPKGDLQNVPGVSLAGLEETKRIGGDTGRETAVRDFLKPSQGKVEDVLQEMPEGWEEAAAGEKHKKEIDIEAVKDIKQKLTTTVLDACYLMAHLIWKPNSPMEHDEKQEWKGITKQVNKLVEKDVSSEDAWEFVKDTIRKHYPRASMTRIDEMRKME